MSCRAMGRSTRVGQEVARRQGKGQSTALLGFLQESEAGQGRAYSVGLASWNNSGGLWGIGVVPSCLVSTWP